MVEALKSEGLVLSDMWGTCSAVVLVCGEDGLKWSGVTRLRLSQRTSTRGSERARKSLFLLNQQAPLPARRLPSFHTDPVHFSYSPVSPMPKHQNPSNIRMARLVSSGSSLAATTAASAGNINIRVDDHEAQPKPKLHLPLWAAALREGATPSLALPSLSSVCMCIRNLTRISIHRAR